MLWIRPSAEAVSLITTECKPFWYPHDRPVPQDVLPAELALPSERHPLDTDAHEASLQSLSHQRAADGADILGLSLCDLVALLPKTPQKPQKTRHMFLDPLEPQAPLPLDFDPRLRLAGILPPPRTESAAYSSCPLSQWPAPDCPQIPAFLAPSANNPAPSYQQRLAEVAPFVHMLICGPLCSLQEVDFCAQVASESQRPVWMMWRLHPRQKGCLSSGEPLLQALHRLKGLPIHGLLLSLEDLAIAEEALAIHRRYSDLPLGFMLSPALCQDPQALSKILRRLVAARIKTIGVPPEALPQSRALLNSLHASLAIAASSSQPDSQEGSSALFCRSETPA